MTQSKAKVPYQKTVFVCTHSRDDGRISCANPGRVGAEICSILKKGIKDADLKGKIRIVKSGCLDLCAQGPNLLIYPEGEWRAGVTVEDAKTLLNELKTFGSSENK